MKATRHAFATTQLAWLRRGQTDSDFSEQLAHLLSDEGVSLFDSARRERSYTTEEEPLVAQQVAYLAAQGVLAESRAWSAELLRAPIHVGSESELPHQLVSLLLREGGKHSVYANPANGRVSALPRHAEINDFLARKICRDLEIHRGVRGPYLAVVLAGIAVAATPAVRPHSLPRSAETGRARTRRRTDCLR